MAFSSTTIYALYINILLIILLPTITNALGTFQFDVHHRYSDAVKHVLGPHHLHGLPEKGTHHYVAALAHRDRLIHRRRSPHSNTTLAFLAGNETVQIPRLGFLHYVNISVGTPALWFLVALDTGSDLLWLPCDCGDSCVRSLTTKTKNKIDLNIYSPNISSTSSSVSCFSSFCQREMGCFSARRACPYEVHYREANTSSSGIMVHDVLHLTTDDTQLKSVDAPVILGCGIHQTGPFLSYGSPNGLLGLGMDKISIPSTLARGGHTADSFSMCFGPDGIGRFTFGDKGSPNMSQTPFVDEYDRFYKIGMTQITVGDNVTDINLTALFDSGTSFTYLSDPAYTIVSKNFDSLIQLKRLSPDPNFLPFSYCYESSANEYSVKAANISLRTQGGEQFHVAYPAEILPFRRGRNIYCLGVLKSEDDFSIIGQNLMRGYKVVFDREDMVLRWKASDCYVGKKPTTLPPKSAFYSRGDRREPGESNDSGPSAKTRNQSLCLGFSAYSMLLVPIIVLVIIM